MPETAVDKDNFSSSGKYKVRSSGKVRLMEPIAVPHAMNELPNKQLRLRVL